MKQKHRKTFFAAALVASLTLAVPAAWADPPKALVYKSPTCGCCSKWIDHLKKNGFEVESKDVHDVRPIKQANGVPPGSTKRVCCGRDAVMTSMACSSSVTSASVSVDEAEIANPA